MSSSREMPLLEALDRKKVGDRTLESRNELLALFLSVLSLQADFW